MLTKETLDELARFFEPKQVQWKPQTLSGDRTRALATAYVDARDVMNRLDRVVGGEWTFTWEPLASGEVMGVLTVCGVTRSDVGERGSPPLGDTLKAAVSDALKRCAVHFGVARYLYYLPAQWVAYDPERKRLAETPRLPSWATPGSEPKIAEAAGPATAAEEMVAVPVRSEVEPVYEAKPAIRSSVSPLTDRSTARPWDAETTRGMVLKKITKLNDMRDASGGKTGLTAGRLNDLFGGSPPEARDQLRHGLLMYLLGTETTKELTVGQCDALIAWSSDTSTDGDGSTIWLPNGNAVSEAASIVAAYEREHGQAELETGGEA
jgi:hypothetical protein